MKKVAIALFLVIFTLFGLTGCDIVMGILGISFGTVDLTVSISSNNSNSVFITITNNGDEPEANVYYSVVLSTNTTIDPSKPRVYEGYSDVYAGQSENITISFDDLNANAIAAGIAGNQYHIGVIVDPNDNIDEDNEYNNKDYTLNTYYFGASPGDAFEDDNAASEATSMNPGETQTHNLTDADEDWIELYAAQGASYTVETSYPGSGNVVDTVLYILDSGETQLYYNDNISDTDYYSTYTFTADYTGTYYLKIAGYTTSSIGAYDVSIYFNGVSPSPIWVEFNTTEPAAISTVGEGDWYTVDVLAGAEYTFDTFALSGGVAMDTVLEVFDENLGFIGKNDDKASEDLYSSFMYTPTYDHAVYILVYEYASDQTGDYEFFVAADGTVSVTVQ